MKAAIDTHVFATGPGQDLRAYLNSKKVEELLFIGHPLFYSPAVEGSGYDIYRRGILIKSFRTKNYNVSILIKYFLSFFQSIYWGFKFVKKYDIWVGCNNLNSLTGLILKKLGLVKKCVYYVIDYNPDRFSSKWLNYIYHKVDKFCVTFCDETWNLSPRMEEGRKKYFNFSGGNQLVVPVGVWLDRIKKTSTHEFNPHEVIFQGHLLEKQGVQHMLKALPEIIKQISDFKLTIIGDGPYKPELEKLSKDLGITSYVEFTGFIKEHPKLESKLCKAAIAIALYNKYEDNGTLSFTYFSDPGKLKVYLACGLPVLTTDVPHNAQEITHLGCGMIVNYDSASICSAVLHYLSNPDTLISAREKAVEYSRKYDWEDIFGKLIGKEI